MPLGVLSVRRLTNYYFPFTVSLAGYFATCTVFTFHLHTITLLVLVITPPGGVIIDLFPARCR